MTIWVDADACPVPARDILCRAAIRTGVTLLFVANQMIPVTRATNIRSIQVPQGLDAADNEILLRAEPGDLIITSDIPLAADLIAKGCTCLTNRGETLTSNNVRAKLNMRDFMETMRSSGVEMRGGPAAYSNQDKQAFANKLDQWLAKNPNRSRPADTQAGEPEVKS